MSPLFLTLADTAIFIRTRITLLETNPDTLSDSVLLIPFLTDPDTEFSSRILILHFIASCIYKKKVSPFMPIPYQNSLFLLIKLMDY
jgi:hypothetical protein